MGIGIDDLNISEDEAEGVAALRALRSDGWIVAVHNDYRLNGEAHTFWLFTHPSGRWLKGEGRTDGIALRSCVVQASKG
jgi:hypothetical protein